MGILLLSLKVMFNIKTTDQQHFQFFFNINILQHEATCLYKM